MELSKRSAGCAAMSANIAAAIATFAQNYPRQICFAGVPSAVKNCRYGPPLLHP